MQFPPRRLPLAAAVCALLAACAHQQAGPKPDLGAAARLRVADAADASGNRDLAVSMYKAAAAEAASDPAMLGQAAAGLAKNGEIDGAEQVLGRALATRPAQPDLLRSLATIHITAGRPGVALGELDKLLAVRPGDLNALVDKGVALDLLKRHREAQGLYAQALARSPDDPVVRNDMALSMMLEGRIDEAREMLAPLRDTGSLPDRARNNLGLLYAASGNPAESGKILDGRISEQSVAELAQAIPGAAALSAPAGAPGTP